jgi:hypothetical protein
MADIFANDLRRIAPSGISEKVHGPLRIRLSTGRNDNTLTLNPEGAIGGQMGFDPAEWGCNDKSSA